MDLIKRIPHIANESILDAIYDIINSEEEDIVKFTKEQEEQVLRSNKQYEDGHYITSEQAEKNIKKWLEA